MSRTEPDAARRMDELTTAQAAALSRLTPEQIRVMGEFADNVLAGRRVCHWIGWIGGIAVGVAAFAYYTVSALSGWHGLGK